MPLFDKLKQAAEQLSDGAQRQAKQLQLQHKIGQLQGQIEREFTAAGKRVREMYRRRDITDGDLLLIMNRVDELESEVQSLREEIQRLQTPAPPQPEPVAAAPPTAAAPVYGPPVSPTADAGSAPPGQPGAYQPPPVAAPPAAAPPPAEEEMLCPHCGGRVRATAKFCSECGKALEG